jgi:hypothetical protein
MMTKQRHDSTILEMATLIAQGRIPIDSVAIPTRTSLHSDINGNIIANTELLAWMRGIPDFDLIMLLSEIDQYGWDFALKTIKMMQDAGV